MTRHSELQTASLQSFGVIGRAVAATLLTFVVACNAPGPLQQAAEARQLLTTLQAEFARAAEASNRAVVTEADPASSAATREAEAARARVKSTERKLDRLLVELRYTDERKVLRAFHGKFAAYEVLDAKILELAVEKTNVKATRLAFGPARAAADAFKDALFQLPSTDTKVRALVLEAVLAVRELQTLEPPHIADPNELAMTRMEQQMSAHEAAARAALEQLRSGLGAAALQTPTAALDRFMKANAELVALSRRNTNVRSLELTLGQKRDIVATCDESLRALHEALVERAQRPTR